MIKRNYRNGKVSEATSEELVFELMKRNMVQDAPVKMQFYTPHKTCCIGIGNDNTADIIIDCDSLSELDRLVAMHNDLSR